MKKKASVGEKIFASSILKRNGMLTANTKDSQVFIWLAIISISIFVMWLQNL